MVTESRVRTEKLWCSSRHKPLKKGKRAIFELDDDGQFEGAYCIPCAEENGIANDAYYDDSTHPFSSEGLGQWTDW